jgi:hypothetical protein
MVVLLGEYVVAEWAFYSADVMVSLLDASRVDYSDFLLVEMMAARKAVN